MLIIIDDVVGNSTFETDCLCWPGCGCCRCRGCLFVWLFVCVVVSLCGCLFVCLFVCGCLFVVVCLCGCLCVLAGRVSEGFL